MRVRIEDKTERSVCDCPGDGVDCRFVRMSSNGDTIDVMPDRATTPATSGTRAVEGMRGGKTFLTRWS